MPPRLSTPKLSTRRSTRLQAPKATSDKLYIANDEQSTLQANKNSQKRAAPKTLGAKAKKQRKGYQDPFSATEDVSNVSNASQTVSNVPDDVPLVLVPEPILSVAETIRFDEDRQVTRQSKGKMREEAVAITESPSSFGPLDPALQIALMESLAPAGMVSKRQDVFTDSSLSHTHPATFSFASTSKLDPLDIEFPPVHPPSPTQSMKSVFKSSILPTYATQSPLSSPTPMMPPSHVPDRKDTPIAAKSVLLGPSSSPFVPRSMKTDLQGLLSNQRLKTPLASTSGKPPFSRHSESKSSKSKVVCTPSDALVQKPLFSLPKTYFKPTSLAVGFTHPQSVHSKHASSQGKPNKSETSRHSTPTPSKNEHESSSLLLSVAPSAPRGTIPKAVTDNLASLKADLATVNSEIHAVKKQVTRGEENQEKLRDTFEFMCSEYERMEKNVITLQTAVIRIEDSVAAHDQKLDDIYLLLEKLELGEDIQQKRSDSKSTKGARRDNLFNTATREAFFRLLGTSGNNLVNLHPLDQGFWVPDPENDGAYFLRPNWHGTLSENTEWHTDVERYLRQAAPNIIPGFTQEMMDTKNDGDLQARIGQLFKTYSQKYRKHNKTLSSDEGDESDVADDNVVNRRRLRKLRKAEERLKARSLSKLTHPDFDFFFQPAYQSTDETDNGEYFDPDSDDNAQAPITSKKRRPWLSRAPNYRSAELSALIETLDTYVKKEREALARDFPGQNRSHPRQRGETKYKPLPRLKHKKKKIPRNAIDLDFLQKYPGQDVPSRVFHDGDDGDVEDEQEVDANGYEDYNEDD